MRHSAVLGIRTDGWKFQPYCETCGWFGIWRMRRPRALEDANRHLANHEAATA